ncbi:MAG: hypothetical protein K6E13_03255 [Lachnospiraceae bacterium]|nr:hypothetical protein [Lachnospiraceae bacterium]
MKKLKGTVSLTVVLAICIMLFMTGCRGKNLDVSRSTVYVAKDASVVSVDIEDFAEDYYSEEELNDYISGIIDSYTENYGDTVKLDSIKVEDSVATVKISYDTVNDYVKLNGLSLFSGTVSEAKADGYSFDGSFYDVSDMSTVTYSPDSEDYVVVAKCVGDILVDGTIKYVSVVDEGQLVVSDKKDSAGYDGENLLEKTFIVIYNR